MHGKHAKSVVQKTVLLVGHAVAVGVVAWLLFLGGLEALRLTPGDPSRRILILACSSIYLFRFLLTVLVFIKREMDWGEVGMVLPWLWIIHLAMAFLGGRNPEPVGMVGTVGAVFYIVGSYLNSASEFERFVRKNRPENQGKLYTQGLFRYSMHINYFGDVMLFTGFALVTGSAWALLIPSLTTAGFIRAHIPALDRHLKDRYGQQFDDYAARTKKRVPFVY
jgi:protein-S-isoprenylcysteine O-methyltransferase Ste14